MNIELPGSALMILNSRRHYRIFVTSDTNFSMPNKLQGTPFKDVEEMDERIIEKWNDIINKEDVVIHAGNFGNLTMRERLNGTIFLIPGPQEYFDHDGPNKLIAQFSITRDTKDLYEIPLPIDLNHDNKKTIHEQVERYRRLLKESFKFDDVLIYDEANMSSYNFVIKSNIDDGLYAIAAGVKVIGQNEEYISRSHLLYGPDNTVISSMNTNIRQHNFTPVNMLEAIFRGREI